MNQPVGDLRIFSLVGFLEFVNSFEPLYNGHLWDKKCFLRREVVVIPCAHEKTGAREGDTHDTTGHYTSLVSPSRRPFSLSPTTSKGLLRRLWLSVKVRLGSVVRTPVSANPGLNFNLGFFFFLTCEPRDFFTLSPNGEPVHRLFLFIKSTLSDNFLYSF